MGQPRQYYTPYELSILTGLSYSLVLSELRAGEIPASYIRLPHRHVGRWRIAVHDAVAYCRRIGLRSAEPAEPAEPKPQTAR